LPNLPTSKLVESGQQIPLKNHIKDILNHYDIVQAPRDLLNGLTLPKEGRFFMVVPENPQQWWDE
jgi:hypothetical protein